MVGQPFVFRRWHAKDTGHLFQSFQLAFQSRHLFLVFSLRRRRRDREINRSIFGPRVQVIIENLSVGQPPVLFQRQVKAVQKKGNDGLAAKDRRKPPLGGRGDSQFGEESPFVDGGGIFNPGNDSRITRCSIA